MGKTVAVSLVKDLLALHGYQMVRSRGSHCQYSAGPHTPTITIAFHGKEMPFGTVRSAFHTAGGPIAATFDAIMGAGDSSRALKEQKKLARALSPSPF